MSTNAFSSHYHVDYIELKKVQDELKELQSKVKLLEARREELEEKVEHKKCSLLKILDSKFDTIVLDYLSKNKSKSNFSLAAWDSGTSLKELPIAISCTICHP
jgi:hypothetical protein